MSTKSDVNTANDDRAFLTDAQVKSLLGRKKEVHRFTKFAFGLMGCDVPVKSILDDLKAGATAEIAGKQARAMKHGLAILNNNTRTAYFVEVDEKKLSVLEESITAPKAAVKKSVTKKKSVKK